MSQSINRSEKKVEYSGDIAIIGMAGLFPKARNLREFWQNILDKVDGVEESSAEWSRSFYDPDSPDIDRLYTIKGGRIDGLTQFNPIEFGIMPNAIDGGQPDQFLGLKIARDALLDSGYLDKSFNNQGTGVIIGHGANIHRGSGSIMAQGFLMDQVIDLFRKMFPDLAEDDLVHLKKELNRSLPPFTAEVLPALVPNIIAGRIANRLDLMGPNFVVDAACASSTLAIEMAIKELRSGRCDMMLTGGVHGSIPPQVYMLFCEIQALSRTNVRPFDAKADGTLMGEGLGMIVLKRVEDAQRDDDRIYAVIKGVASSSDGKAFGLLAPRIEGEILALQRAYAETGIDPATISIVEAHGTGIPLGDRTEMACLGSIFGAREKRLPTIALGSIKSMIGHCLTAAGIAGVIKTSLSIYHKLLPPTLCDQVSDQIGIENTPFYINNQTRPWIHASPDIPRRAGVNAFGFGGTNTHAILEEYPGSDSERKNLHTRWPAELFLYSAGSRKLLAERIRTAKEALLTSEETPLCILAQDNHGVDDKSGKSRLAVIATNFHDFLAKLETAVDLLTGDSEKPRFPEHKGLFYSEKRLEGKTAFLITGQGSQYPNMMADLCLHFPPVRQWFDFLDQTFYDREVPPSHLLFPPPTCLSLEEQEAITRQLFDIEIGTDVMTTSAFAMYDLFREFKINAEGIVGHSTGEHTAMWISGAVVYPGKEKHRSLMRRFNELYHQLEKEKGVPEGVSLSIGAIDRERVIELVDSSRGSLYFSLDNCPNQMVIFGQPSAIDQAKSDLESKGAICEKLPFSKAYHTPLYRETGEAGADTHRAMQAGQRTMEFYSCVTAEQFPEEMESISRLAIEHHYHRVRFRDTIERMYEDGYRNFIEVGPGNNLSSFVQDILQGREFLTIPSNLRHLTGIEGFLRMLGKLYVMGRSFNSDALFKYRDLERFRQEIADQNDPVKQKSTVTLSLDMPLMRLDDQYITDLRNKICPPGTGGEIPGKRAGFQPESQQNILPDDKTHDPRTAILMDHFALMNEFLAGQERIMQKWVQRTTEDHEPNAEISSSPAPPEAEQSVVEMAVPVSQDPVQFHQLWPALGKVLEKTTEKLVAERTYTVETDIFILDHAIGHTPSQNQPELHSLPIFPFTMSMETLAEAGLYLVGDGYVPIGLNEMRGHRWMALDRGSLTIRIEATRLKPEGEKQRVLVRLFQVDKQEGEERKLLAFDGTAILAPGYPEKYEAHSFQNPELNPSQYTKETLYNDGIPRDHRMYGQFHGTRFQGLEKIRGWNSEGLECDITILPKDDLFRDIPNPRFQMDPLLVDTGGQLASHWVSERYEVDLNIFPYRMRSYRCFTPTLEPGAKLLCRTFMRFVDAGDPDTETDARFEFLDEKGEVITVLPEEPGDFKFPEHYYQIVLQPRSVVIEETVEYIDESGNVVAVIDSLHNRYFSIPRPYALCGLYPQFLYHSREWLRKETGHILRLTIPAPVPFFEEAWEIWKRNAVHLMLNKNEQDEWYGLVVPPERKTEWFESRATAKDALRQWTEEQHDLHIAPIDLEIRHEKSGKPYAVSEVFPELNFPPFSISHHQGYYAAVIGEEDERIGLDIVLISGVDWQDIIRTGFQDQEYSMITGEVNEPSDELVAKLWCAKEAAGKALGTGLRFDPGSLRIVEYDSETGNVIVQASGDKVPVAVRVEDGLAIALCIIPTGTDEP